MASERVALVTGSSSGIGMAVARALVADGWSVCMNGRDARKLDEACRQLTDGPGRAVAVPGDVSRQEEARDLVHRAVGELGGLDLLVNNAGIGAWGTVSELTLADWERALAVDLTSVFLVTRESLPALRERSGYVVNIASLAGKKGIPGASAYCAAKHGLVGFNDALLREEAPGGVRATAICPAYVATPMVLDSADVPAGEMIQPEDIAATVQYLLDLSPRVVIREIVLERVGGL